MFQAWIKKNAGKLGVPSWASLTPKERIELENLRKQNRDILKELHVARKRNFIPRSKISTAGPSIFLITIPKSATSHISHSLAKSLGYDHCSSVCTPVFPDNFLFPAMMRDFQKGGMVSVSHMRPTRWNMKVFKGFGGKKSLCIFATHALYW